MIVIVCKGLPGSGKSTWARTEVDKNKNNLKLINKDSLRIMLDNDNYSSHSEEFIKKARNLLIELSLSERKNVIIDDTNLKSTDVQSIKDIVREIAKKLEVTVQVVTKDFTDVPVEECIKRDLKRVSSVGEKVIRDMYEKYIEIPAPLLIQNTLLPRVYICDIDGTCAKMVSRGPFEWNKVGEDEPIIPVFNLLKVLQNTQGINIIFMSGRDEVCYNDTIYWLREHFGNFDFLLYMRPKGDMRKDSLIKRELFDTYIRDKFYIEGVFDDRDQVVSLWRKEIGLQTYQCNYGNF